MTESNVRVGTQVALDDVREPRWQYSYVAKYADGSGVRERVTFDTLAKAETWLRDNADDVTAWNAEVPPGDVLVAAVERRQVWEPGEWEPVTVAAEGSA
jgi:hypothetical protein